MEKMETEEPKDDEDELAALMVASTTVRKRKLEVGSAVNTKRRKQLKDLAVLTSSSSASQKEREQNFAVNYFNKLKEQLDEASFAKVMKLLSNFDGTSEGVVDLFKEMSTKLPVALAEEFLCFLTPSQAHLCGKFMDHLILSKMTDFFRKFEISFAKQPQMLRKFYDVLCQLASSENVSLQHVRDTVLPLLKSKSFLMEYFLQLFPAERPSYCIVLDDFEDIYLNGDCGSEEEIRLATAEDSSSCPCSCHPSHATHCQRCSVKYINGRVYIQSGKILRAAKVEFNGLNPTEAFRRVYVNNEELTPKNKQSRRKPDILNQKDQSPVKHVSSPHTTVTESEDESLEIKANNLSTNKPKSVRSLKLKFKSSEKLSAKTKNSKADEVSEEMRMISDENAITDTPDCFLAKRLSPLESVDNATVGSNLNFNNILSDNQNDPSRQANHESTLNFSVHSPLKRASICLDSLDSTSESIQSPIKINQRLHIPLKRLEDDELLIAMNNKGFSSSESSSTQLELINSSFEITKIKHSKQETSMNSSISENIDSIFTTSDVDEMNLLLGSGVNKMNALIEPNDCEIVKSAQNGAEKYSEPTLDSLSIDSFLNISNLDAKIDSFLTNAEEAKNLDALLNDSSLENSNTDQSISINVSDFVMKEESDPNLSRGSKDIAESSNNVIEEKKNILLLKPEQLALKVDNNMDSLLNLIDQDVSETKIHSSTDGARDSLNEPPCANFEPTASLRGSNDQTPQDNNEIQNSHKMKNSSKLTQLSPRNENELKLEEIVADNDKKMPEISISECHQYGSVAQLICDFPDFEKNEISLNVNNGISVFECPPEMFGDSKVNCSVSKHKEVFPECTSVPSAIVASQENVTMMESVQSVSFICGEEGDESGKVTLFSAEGIEDKIPHDDIVVSIPIALGQNELSDEQIQSSINADLGKMVTNCASFSAHAKDNQNCGKFMPFKSSPSPSKDTQGSGVPMLSNTASSLLRNAHKVEKSMPSDFSSSISKDIKISEKVVSSDSSPAPSKDTQGSGKSISLDSGSSFLKNAQKVEKSMFSDFSSSISKNTKISEKVVTSDFSPAFSKDTQESEKSISSDSASSFLRNSQKVERSLLSDFSLSISKDTKKSEKVVTSDSSPEILKDTQENGTSISPDPSLGLSNDTQKSEKSMSLDSSTHFSKDTQKHEKFDSVDSSSAHSKDTQKSGVSIYSDFSSPLLKDTRNSEKFIFSDSSRGLSKDIKKIEEVVSSDHSKETEKSEKPVSSEVLSQTSNEESSQIDTIVDQCSDSGGKSKDHGNDWTMEEDKIILQTFQKDPDMQDIFSKIKTQLPERSLSEVQSRFYVLIELLEKMSHSSDDVSKKK